MEQVRVILVRHHFKVLDLNSWLSALIRFFTKGYYNHSALLTVENGVWFVTEARSAGIVKSTFRYWKAHRPNKEFVVGECKLPLNEERFHETLGAPYDIKSLFQQAAFVVTGKWFGRQDANKVNCAEVIAYYYELPEPHKWTPEKIKQSNLFGKWKTL